MTNLINLTENKKNLLIEIKDCQREESYSEFLGEDVGTKSRAGTLSNLVQKGLVRDGFKGLDDSIQMYLITDKAIEFLGLAEDFYNRD